MVLNCMPGMILNILLVLTQLILTSTLGVFLLFSFYREGNWGIASRWILFSWRPSGSNPRLLSMSLYHMSKALFDCGKDTSCHVFSKTHLMGWGVTTYGSNSKYKTECYHHGEVGIGTGNLTEEGKLGSVLWIGVFEFGGEGQAMIKHFSTTLSKILDALEGILLK